MRKILPTVLLGMLYLISAGCCSTVTRMLASSDEPPQPQYFGGVHADFSTINGSPACTNDIWAAVFCTFDLPLSFCADILSLPYDIHTDHAYQKWKAGMTNTLPATSLGPGAIGVDSSADAGGESSHRGSAFVR
jgi:uncharacterized protein YceK